MKRIFLILLTVLTAYSLAAKEVTIYKSEKASSRIVFGIEKLEKALTDNGYVVKVENVTDKKISKQLFRKSKTPRIFVAELGDDMMVKYHIKKKIKSTREYRKEGFRINTIDNTILLQGFDASGALYACLDLKDKIQENKTLPLDLNYVDQPEMVLRGTCIGMQKPYYLPGRTVYEYPYTYENFPWFYDKQMWIKYLDMLVENRMNSLYLWNGHPFASLVRLPDYPFAVEVSDEDFARNEEIFKFLTEEADKRGIWVLQMFYNIIVSKPFAEHYGIATQDSHRPITPLLSDYTRKSITEFIRKYPNVGLLVCLGEAMATYEDDVQWFTKTIIPGVKDGLKALGKTEEVPIILRAHDTNCKMVMDSALPIYKNLYTMNKYNGESLVTYNPGGPWAKWHKDLSDLGSTHISNVHILANLEPFRWSSPDFIQKSVKAMHSVHGANALHLYPQASYWDWPYAADKADNRILQIDRDWLWYEGWARYAWKSDRNREDEINYWAKKIDDFYGSGQQSRNILKAYEEMGEISPMLTRKFAITEGNRQTFLLGSFMSQIINPKRWTVYPDFPASCDIESERLDEWVNKEWLKQPHLPNNPKNVIDEVKAHADASVEAINGVVSVQKNKAEFSRLKNDVLCMNEFAYFMADRVEAAMLVMRYDNSKDINDLDNALKLIERSVSRYENLVKLTSDKYLYANSMQTKQRRIPIGGDDGKYKTWAELLPKYIEEVDNFKRNIQRLKLMQSGQFVQKAVSPLKQVEVTLKDTSLKLVAIKESENIFTDRESSILKIADELKSLKGLRFSFDKQKSNPSEISFTCNKPVTVLVGYFSSIHTNYLFPPKLETDASANDYGQADMKLMNALEIKGQPPVNVHTYTFPAGNNRLKLSKGVVLILGFTDGNIPVKVRDAGLGEKTNPDWLFN
jgi:prefoldin subunit 5